MREGFSVRLITVLDERGCREALSPAWAVLKRDLVFANGISLGSPFVSRLINSENFGGNTYPRRPASGVEKPAVRERARCQCRNGSQYYGGARGSRVLIVTPYLLWESPYRPGISIFRE